MKLSISNIGWDAEQDEAVYRLMGAYGFSGLEIAPTRIFPEAPYSQREAAKRWSENLKAQYGFGVSSMQSIWYGRQEKLFGNEEERQVLLAYTKEAIDFAAAVGCGNNKDSIEDVPRFIEKLREGYDFVQGSRFVPGGVAINTPLLRTISVKLIHAPLISLAAGFRFTDTTNAYRAYSMEYLTDERVQPLRDVFRTYELLAYLSVRATQLGMRACEIPVTRAYPKTGKTPTKISFFKGNWNLMEILLKTLFGAYNPK